MISSFNHGTTSTHVQPGHRQRDQLAPLALQAELQRQEADGPQLVRGTPEQAVLGAQQICKTLTSTSRRADDSLLTVGFLRAVLHVVELPATALLHDTQQQFLHRGAPCAVTYSGIL